MLDDPTRLNQCEEIAEGAAISATASTGPQTRALLRVIFVILAVVAALWALYALEAVLLLVVLAMFFAYFIAPVVEVVRRPFVLRRRERFMPRALAIGVVYIVLFGSGVIACYLVLPSLSNQLTAFARQAPTYLAQGRDRVKSWDYLINRDHVPVTVRDAVDRMVARTMAAGEDHLSHAVVGVIEFVSYLPWLVLIPILAFFLLKDAEAFRRSALLSLPLGQLRGRGAEFFQDVNLTLAAYIRAQLIACVLIGTVCTIGFVSLGVPYALMLGLLAGLLEFIPLVGPLVLALSASAISSFHSVGQAVAVLLFLAVLRITHDYVVYPRLMGQGVHLHPLAIILAILCGAELGGIAGIFLAIPVTAVLSVSYRHWLEYKGSEGLVADLLKSQEAPIIIPESAVTPSPVKPSAVGMNATRGTQPSAPSKFTRPLP
jgi:predicted PurR-regulated permease PerM